jgi:hypothetical protein
MISQEDPRPSVKFIFSRLSYFRSRRNQIKLIFNLLPARKQYVAHHEDHLEGYTACAYIARIS